MEVPLKAGRQFTAQDTASSPRVAIVNEAFVRAFFQGSNPIGSHISALRQAPAAGQIEIVGIAADTKLNSLRDGAPPIYYRPISQFGAASRMTVVRTAQDPAVLIPAIRAAVRDIDSRLPIAGISTQLELINRSYLFNERVFAFASTFFGGLAMLIAMVGLFGLMSYDVARRTKEIGIRMALGAGGSEVMRSVLIEALRLVSIGVVIGLAAALAFTRLIKTLLFGLAPSDPLTVSTAALTMIFVSALAAYAPARRAANVDPMVALRHE